MSETLTMQTVCKGLAENFRLMEDREFAAWTDRDAALVKFVLYALANSANRWADKVLEDIVEARKSHAGETP